MLLCGERSKVIEDKNTAIVELKEKGVDVLALLADGLRKEKSLLDDEAMWSGKVHRNDRLGHKDKTKATHEYNKLLVSLSLALPVVEYDDFSSKPTSEMITELMLKVGGKVKTTEVSLDAPIEVESVE